MKLPVFPTTYHAFHSLQMWASEELSENHTWKETKEQENSFRVTQMAWKTCLWNTGRERGLWKGNHSSQTPFQSDHTKPARSSCWTSTQSCTPAASWLFTDTSTVLCACRHWEEQKCCPCDFKWRWKQTFVLLNSDISPCTNAHFDWASAAARLLLSLPVHRHRRRAWNAGVAAWELPLLIF